MKRIIGLLFIFFIVVCTAFSASLKIYDLDHPIYDLMDSLYILEGKAVPLGTRPWTEIDVEHLLERIDINTEEGWQLEKRILSYISSDENDFRWKFGAAFTPSMYVHSNPNEFNKADDSFYDIDLLNRTLGDVFLGMEYDEYIAAFMDFSLGFAFSDVTDGSNPNAYDQRYNKYFGTNIPFISDGSISLNFPDRTYVALGFDALRFVVARDKISWGNGVMGNMMLGNTLPYHDYVSLTFTGSKNFTYQMLISFFSHSANQEANLDKSTSEPNLTNDRYPLTGLRFFLGHRFEFSFWDGKITAAINESIMYQAENGYLDPRVLNPLMFLHDLYIAGNSNSLVSFEFEYAPINYLSIYLQGAIDDLAVGEVKPGEVGASSDGWGIMGGLRFTLPEKDGNYYFGNFELVYTSPFIYHRALDGKSNDLYYVSSNRYVVSSRVRFITRYLSFPFGSDAIASLLRFGYNDIDLFKAEANIFFMAHGVIDKFSKTDYFSETTGKPQNTPSTSNPFDPDDSGVPEYTLAIGGEGSVNATSYLTIDAGAYLITVWNKDNAKKPAEFDFQLSIGLTIHY